MTRRYSCLIFSSLQYGLKGSLGRFLLGMNDSSQEGCFLVASNPLLESLMAENIIRSIEGSEGLIDLLPFMLLIISWEARKSVYLPLC